MTKSICEEFIKHPHSGLEEFSSNQIKAFWIEFDSNDFFSTLMAFQFSSSVFDSLHI